MNQHIPGISYDAWVLLVDGKYYAGPDIAFDFSEELDQAKVYSDDWLVEMDKQELWVLHGNVEVIKYPSYSRSVH